MKRLVDVIISSLSILILLPIYAVVSLAILIIDGKPIFFIQERIGKNEESFKLIKFRTMQNEISEITNEIDKVTKFGSWLRKTSIDEIPTLINVLVGEMSIVGPRPLLVEYLIHYSDFQKKRHDIKPGITGWAQINGRNLISWDKKFELDVWYVNNQNLILDIKIIFLTFIKLLSQEGINNKTNNIVEKFKSKNEK
jgi:lipopolysaccharide/colanic/teichoic acid biosynthesis glycosyltransferase